MLAFRQPYTNTAARSYAGTFIQHDNLNILRRYLHKPYLPDCLIALITLQFGALSRLHSRFSWVYKHVSIQMWQTPSTVSSGVALVLHSWIHPTYLDGHVKNQVPFLLKTEGGNTGGACTVLFPESPGRDAWTKPSPSSPAGFQGEAEAGPKTGSVSLKLLTESWPNRTLLCRSHTVLIWGYPTASA